MQPLLLQLVAHESKPLWHACVTRGKSLPAEHPGQMVARAIRSGLDHPDSKFTSVIPWKRRSAL